MATFITAGNSYQLFVQWLVKTRKIFDAAGVSEEWEAYFQKIMRRFFVKYFSLFSRQILYSPAVTRKPNLVKEIKSEKRLYSTTLSGSSGGGDAPQPSRASPPIQNRCHGCNSMLQVTKKFLIPTLCLLTNPFSTQLQCLR